MGGVVILQYGAAVHAEYSARMARFPLRGIRAWNDFMLGGILCRFYVTERNEKPHQSQKNRSLYSPNDERDNDQQEKIGIYNVLCIYAHAEEGRAWPIIDTILA